jgi:hypothetical protein
MTTVFILVLNLLSAAGVPVDAPQCHVDESAQQCGDRLYRDAQPTDSERKKPRHGAPETTWDCTDISNGF